MGPRKSSAALSIVCECNVYCLVRTILVRTKSGWVTEKGISPSICMHCIAEMMRCAVMCPCVHK